MYSDFIKIAQKNQQIGFKKCSNLLRNMLEP